MGSDSLRRGTIRVLATHLLSAIVVLLGWSTPLLAAAANHFAVAAPATVAAGAPFSITVTALDASDMVDTAYGGTVHFTKSDSGAGSFVPGDYTFAPGDNGVHTFMNSTGLVTLGIQTVTATDTTSAITGTSNDINVIAPANHFLVTAPATVTAGKAFSVTVSALNPMNAIDTTYRGTIHFTKSDSGAGSFLPADYTFTAADNGVHTFINGAGLVTLGIQTVTATDTASSITGTSNDINVIAPANHLLVTAPATVVAGAPFSVTVTALNPMNAIDTTYTGTIHFTKSDSGAGSFLPANYNFVSADNGVHTFVNGAALVTLGIQTVTATDTASSITGTSDDILVTAPPSPTPSPSMTSTASSTPTRTLVPQGGGCSDPSQCATGLFCSQAVCCDSECTAPNESCAIPGRRGECISTVAAPAPVMSNMALMAAVAMLIGIAALALIRKPR